MGQSDTECLYELKVAVMTTLLEEEGLDAMAAGVLRIFGTRLGWDAGTIWEPAGDVLTARASWSAAAATQHAVVVQARVPRGDGVRNAVMTSARAHREDSSASAGMWIPIVPRDGRVVGLLELLATAPTRPAPAPLEALGHLCALVGVCFERCRVRERLDGELQLTRGQLARLNSSDLIGFMISTTGGRVLQANDAFLRMIQRSRAELETGAVRWDKITPASSLPADQRAVEQLIQNGVAPAYEKEYIRADGTTVPVLMGAALLSVDPMTTVVFVVDNTAQKRVETKLAELNERLEERVASGQAELRALAVRLLNVREQQLAELAREIHDVFGQELTVLKLDLEWLTRRIDDRSGTLASEVAERAAAMEARLDGLFQGMRTIASELRPRVLDDLGLVAAIEAHARVLSRRPGLVIELAMPDDISLDRDLATAIFRIYQELMTNVLRHARATRVEVTVSVSTDLVELRVADNGIGFDPAVRGSDSLGLLGIRERALAFGGAFIIGRGAAGGTLATLSAPWRHEEAMS